MQQTIKQTVVSDNRRVCASVCVRTRFFIASFLIIGSLQRLIWWSKRQLMNIFRNCKFTCCIIYYILYDIILYTSAILHYYLHINSIWYCGWISSVDIHFLRNCTYKVSILLTCKNVYMIFFTKNKWKIVLFKYNNRCVVFKFAIGVNDLIKYLICM